MTSSSLLLLEDDKSLGATLKERLESQGYRATWARTLAEAQKHVARQNYDLLILDVGLPDGSGFDFARRVRLASNSPFIFLTAMDSPEHRLSGYELGAEEYIPKPFHLKELLLRIKRALDKGPSGTINSGELKIDLHSMKIILPDGKENYPTQRDFALLRLLLKSAPQVVSRKQMLDEIKNEGKAPTERTIDNSIVRLRQILSPLDDQYIRSVRGIGYQWVKEIE